MSPNSLVRLASEAVVFLALAGVTSLVVTLIVSRLRRLARPASIRVWGAGTVGAFVIVELWAQFSHRERLGHFTLFLCVLAALLVTTVTAFAYRPRTDQLRD